jgi:hypothetical protein
VLKNRRFLACKNGTFSRHEIKDFVAYHKSKICNTPSQHLSSKIEDFWDAKNGTFLSTSTFGRTVRTFGSTVRTSFYQYFCGGESGYRAKGEYREAVVSYHTPSSPPIRMRKSFISSDDGRID